MIEDCVSSLHGGYNDYIVFSKVLERFRFTFIIAAEISKALQYPHLSIKPDLYQKCPL